MRVADAIAPLVDAGTCPHLAMLLRSEAEVPGALASFFALGAQRGGWLMHRALPGRLASDRVALRAAGLDVDGLEAAGRLELAELHLDLAPQDWARPWVPVLDRALARGFDAVWWSRFPIGPTDEAYRASLPYDRAWEACFHGRRAVSLCLYVVGELAPEDEAERVGTLAAFHDGVLTHDGLVSARTPSRA